MGKSKGPDKRRQEFKKLRRHLPRLPASVLAPNDNKIKLPTPDGGFVYYPLELGLKGRDLNEYSIFMTISHRSGTTYIVSTNDREATFRLSLTSGLTSKEIVMLYEGLPFEEHTIIDHNGIFYYKSVPQNIDLDEYFDGLVKNLDATV